MSNEAKTPVDGQQAMPRAASRQPSGKAALDGTAIHHEPDFNGDSRLGHVEEHARFERACPRLSNANCWRSKFRRMFWKLETASKMFKHREVAHPFECAPFSHDQKGRGSDL